MILPCPLLNLLNRNCDHGWREVCWGWDGSSRLRRSYCSAPVTHTPPHPQPVDNSSHTSRNCLRRLPPGPGPSHAIRPVCLPLGSVALPAAGAQVAPGPGVNPGAEPADEPLHGGQLTGLALPVAAASVGGCGVRHWLRPPDSQGKPDHHATEGESDPTGSDLARDLGSNRRNTDLHTFLLCEDFLLRQGDCHETKP